MCLPLSGGPPQRVPVPSHPHHVRLLPVTLDVSLSDRTTPSTDFFFSLNSKIKGCFLLEVGSRADGSQRAFWEDGFN